MYHDRHRCNHHNRRRPCDHLVFGLSGGNLVSIVSDLHPSCCSCVPHIHICVPHILPGSVSVTENGTVE